MSVKIEITFSKIFAVIIIALSFVISYHLKEATVITIGIAASSALIGNKQIQDRLKKPKENENI